MIFRQLFDSTSCTYTYILASRTGGEALIIDPVLEKTDHYLRVISELDLKLVKAIDTHVHADHITGLGALRDHTHCVTVMGKQSSVDIVSMRVDEGDTVDIENISLQVLYTPGHTDDSYCFKLDDRIFTGDTLLIRGTGRTDFQHGNAHAQYNSIFGKLLTLPDDMLVYPGHDYKGDTVSTIAEERAFNPRLQVTSADHYADIMENLNLPNPKLMDVAVPANQKIGLRQDEAALKDSTVDARTATQLLDDTSVVFIDLREESERQTNGIIPGAMHVPYPTLTDAISTGRSLNILATRMETRLLLFCAYGERSALALQDMQEAGFQNVIHMAGGMGDWVEHSGTVGRVT
ncbi:MAG: MBL fold metallo-hydrolase [Rhodospirillales bacterium]|nr:MBL fold metallo-hydrolase [Rhodospirillales bacterium]